MCNCDRENGYICSVHRLLKTAKTNVCKNCGEEIYYGTSSNPTLMALRMNDTVDWYHVNSGTATCRIMIAEPKG